MSTWILWALAAFVMFKMMKPSVPAEGRLDPSGLREALRLGGVQLVDVRSPGEYQAGHVPGARLIPLGELQGRLGELDKAKPVVAMCASGNRSASAYKIIKAAGFGDVRHLEGGISRWAAAGYPVQR